MPPMGGMSSGGGGGAPSFTNTEIGGANVPRGFYDASFLNFLRRPGTREQAHAPEGKILTPNEQAIEAAKTKALIAQYRAQSDPPPTTLTYPVGSAGFYTPDVGHMSGAQRKAYLPESSEEIPLPPKRPQTTLERDATMSGWGPSGQDIEAQKGAGTPGAGWGGEREQREELIRQFYSGRGNRGNVDRGGGSRRDEGGDAGWRG